jgi:hypothetical protein
MRIMYTILALSAALNTEATAQDAGRAQMLMKQADAIQLVREFPRKAKLYEDAAALFPRGDQEGEASLRSAATLQYYLGNHRRAQQLLERAGNEAAYRGDIVAAADAFINATFLALQRESFSDARRLIEHTKVLASAPTLTDGERASIQRRISQPVATLTVKER